MAKATKKEVQDRVNYIIKLMAAGMRSSDIVQNVAVKAWGISERKVWDYIARALTYFKERANIDRDGELGKILEQYEMLFIQAMKSEDYRLCVTILDKRAELIGLKETSIKAEVTYKTEIIPPEGIDEENI